jgi:hypothetical protein
MLVLSSHGLEEGGMTILRVNVTDPEVKLERMKMKILQFSVLRQEDGSNKTENEKTSGQASREIMSNAEQAEPLLLIGRCGS